MNFLRSTVRLVFWGAFAMICGIVLISAAIFLYLGPSLPSVETLKTIQLQTPLRIYSADNKLIDEFGEQRRTPLRFDQIPPAFVQALIAVEDRRFESHIGVDAKGFARAVLEFVSSGEKGGGGSTLTQQVAKNYFLTNKKLFTRKFKEILLSFQMERILTKQEIFELYANKNFFGHRAYGVQAAAQVYYGRDINDLTLPELAMVAGLPQRPSKANPISYPDAAKKRRNQVLQDMFEMGFISEPTFIQALNTPLTASFHGNNPDFEAPWVAEMVRDEMVQRYGDGTYFDGYRVFTTINSRYQVTANAAVRKGLIDYTKRHGYFGPYKVLSYDPDKDLEEQTEFWIDAIKDELAYGDLLPAVVIQVNEQSLDLRLRTGEPVTLEWDQIEWARRYIDHSTRGSQPETASEIAQPGHVIWIEKIEGIWHLSQLPQVQGALVSVDPNDGAIQALVGGFDFKQSKYNRVTQARRQPGSNIKPFLYSAALEQGFTAATIINDSPITIHDDVLETTWRPKNSGYVFDGPIRLREALYRSKNVVSIRLLRQMGVRYAVDFITRFGFEEDSLPKNLSLALGSASVPPMNVLEGYAVIANGGYKIEPYLIQRIEDSAGNILYEADPLEVCPECANRAEVSEEEAALLAALEESLTKPKITEEILDPTSLSLIEVEPEPEEERYAPRIMDPKTNYVINSILRDVIKRGTGRRALSLNRNDLAGKTGTTNEGVDAWFSGFNPDIVTTAWVGFDQPASLGRGEWGGATALPIWIDFMKVALEGKPERLLPQPSGMISTRIDPKTGLLARPGQKDAIFEIFAEDKVPTEQAPDEVQMVLEDDGIETEEDLLQAIEGQDPTEDEELTAPEMLF